MQIKVKCLSHTPLRGFNDPEPAVLNQVIHALDEARQEVELFDPELIIVFGPDHFNGLFYDLMPPFVLATHAESVADYNTLPGSLSIPFDLSMALTKHVLESDIDIAISHHLLVDHGCTQSLQELTGSLTRYPVIPIVINAAAPPLCPYRRIRLLGEAVGRFIAKLDKRTLILGTGGLSHEPPVPQFESAADDVKKVLISGRNPSSEDRARRQANTIAAGKLYGTPECQLTPLNPEWDLAFIEMLSENRLAEVDEFDVDVISGTAGRSSHEVRTWIAAFSALAAIGPYQARTDFYRPINEWIAGYGIVSAELC